MDRWREQVKRRRGGRRARRPPTPSDDDGGESYDSGENESRDSDDDKIMSDAESDAESDVALGGLSQRCDAQWCGSLQ